MMAQCAEQLSQLSAERRRNDGLDVELRQVQELVAALQAERDSFQGEVGGLVWRKELECGSRQVQAGMGRWHIGICIAG